MPLCANVLAKSCSLARLLSIGSSWQGAREAAGGYVALVAAASPAARRLLFAVAAIRTHFAYERSTIKKIISLGHVDDVDVDVIVVPGQALGLADEEVVQCCFVCFLFVLGI